MPYGPFPLQRGKFAAVLIQTLIAMNNQFPTLLEIAGPLVTEDAEFFAIFGFAMGRWQSIEGGLSVLCAAASGAMNLEAFSTLFYRSKSFLARVGMVGDAIRYARLEEQIKRRWSDEISKALLTASETRNELIHGRVLFSSGMGKHVLAKDWMNPKNRDIVLGHKPGMTMDEIGEFARVSDALWLRLNQFREEVVDELDYSVECMDYRRKHRIGSEEM